MKKYLAFLFFFGLLSATFAKTVSKDTDFESQMDLFLKNAQKTIGDKDHRVSDYWMARYLGQLCMTEQKTKRSEKDLYPLYDKRWDLTHPLAFISGKYSNGFLSSFFGLPDCMWWGPEANIKPDMSFAVQSNYKENYFAQIWMHPHFQEWSIIGTNTGKDEISNAVIPMGDFDPKPLLRIGKFAKKGNENAMDACDPVYLDIPENLFVQYVWAIGFYDLDGDGIPEIWVRYNLSMADGFTQVLNVYKIKNHKVVLLKSFEGEAEGIACRLPGGKILVGHGTTAKQEGHLGYELTQLETWEYKNGNFVKTGTKTVPNILWTDEWKKYYNENNN